MKNQKLLCGHYSQLKCIFCSNFRSLRGPIYKITINNIYGDNKYEYALRTNPTKENKQKSKRLWNILIEKYNTSEEDIIKMI